MNELLADPTLMALVLQSVSAGTAAEIRRGSLSRKAETELSGFLSGLLNK